MRGIARFLLFIGVTTSVILASLWLLWSQGMDANEAGAAFEQSANAIHDYRWVLAFFRWCLWACLWWHWDRLGRWMRPAASDSEFRDAWRGRRTRMMLAVALVELLIVASC